MSTEFIQILEYKISNKVTKQEYKRNMRYIESIAGHECKTIYGLAITQENSREIVKQLMLNNNDITRIDPERLKIMLNR